MSVSGIGCMHAGQSTSTGPRDRSLVDIEGAGAAEAGVLGLELAPGEGVGGGEGAGRGAVADQLGEAAQRAVVVVGVVVGGGDACIDDGAGDLGEAELPEGEG